MSKIIGLELAFKTSNYGAQLQAFATQRAIERLGFTTKIIQLKNRGVISARKLGRGFFYNLYLRRKNALIRKHTRIDVVDSLYQENRTARRNASEVFISCRLRGVTVYSTYEELVKDAKNMKAVLIGSDQKWTPGFCYSRINSLDFAPKGVRRISYATSLGVADYPRYCRSLSGKMWKKIDFLSVREQQGAKIIKDICGNIPVEVVVDPTYLFSRKEWEEYIPKMPMSDKPYIFCYFLGNNDESKSCAKRYAEQRGLRLISIMSDESYSPYDQKFADEIIRGASPEEFVNWIRGASCVFTDSFHGTAFSVINEKQFFVFYRVRPEARLNRNSRIDNILSLWHLEDRLIVDTNRDWSSVDVKPIDYSLVNVIIESERQHSLDFLTRALHVNEDK